MIQTKIRPANLNIPIINPIIEKKYKENEYLHLYTCPGVGDALWSLFFLLKNNSRPIKIHTLPRENYTSHFLTGIKNVESVDRDYSKCDPHINPPTYFSLSGYSEHLRQFTYYKLRSFDEFTHHSVYLATNQHIDYGRRLEDYLPNMEIDFKIPWKFKINKYQHHRPYILLFTSSEGNNNPKTAPDVGPFWYPKKWNEIIINIKQNYPNLGIIWVGNSFDSSILNTSIDKKLLDDVKLNLNTEQIMNLLHGSIGNIAFQNGVSHIAVYENIPTYFLTFPRLDKISYAWTQPGIENDKILYRPIFFDKFEMHDLLFWISQIYKG